jgi:hypothetical protein
LNKTRILCTCNIIILESEVVIIANKTQYKYEDFHKIIDGVLHKKCAYHEEIFGEEKWLPCTPEYFYKNSKNKSDGLYPECKECSKKRATKWIKNNPDKYKEIMKNTDAKDHRVENRRKWSQQATENGYYREWNAKNPDKVEQYTYYRKMHKTHEITDVQWISCKEYFNNSCAYCGLHISQHFQRYAGKLKNYDFHKEHADDKGSNGLENCVPSCNSCNSSKRQHNVDEWYSPHNRRRGGKVYSKERYDKIIKWITEDYMLYI